MIYPSLLTGALPGCHYDSSDTGTRSPPHPFISMASVDPHFHGFYPQALP